MTPERAAAYVAAWSADELAGQPSPALCRRCGRVLSHYVITRPGQQLHYLCQPSTCGGRTPNHQAGRHHERALRDRAPGARRRARPRRRRRDAAGPRDDAATLRPGASPLPARRPASSWASTTARRSQGSPASNRPRLRPSPRSSVAPLAQIELLAHLGPPEPVLPAGSHVGRRQASARTHRAIVCEVTPRRFATSADVRSASSPIRGNVRVDHQHRRPC